MSILSDYVYVNGTDVVLTDWGLTTIRKKQVLEIKLKEADELEDVMDDVSKEWIEITFSYTPRWPLVGETQNVISMVAKTKQRTIVIVQDAFPDLAQYPPERIQILVQTYHDSFLWAEVMDNAWGSTFDESPYIVKVQLRDLPGDAAARIQHERREQMWIYFVNNGLEPICWIGFILFIIFLLINMWKYVCYIF